MGSIVLCVFIGFFVGIISLQAFRNYQESQRPELKRIPENVQVDFTSVKAHIDDHMKKLPGFILNSITGSGNAEKGKLGELIGYLSMKAEYDRIIPLGNITDFVALKFPTKDSEGYVHFIDIKTGKNAKLTPDQRKLKALLDAKAISFRTIKIDDIETK